MSEIYQQHTNAFSNVSAYVLMNEGEQIGKIAFKFPKDGAGRLWCYFHLHGVEMSRGYAGGYGYDKRSAAAQNAIENMKRYAPDFPVLKEHSDLMNAQADKLRAMFKDIGGKDWADVFRDNNIQVLQAV